MNQYRDDTANESPASPLAAELTRLRAEVARLTPPPGCRWVAVSEELMAQMGEWSDPVRVKIEAVDERQVTLAVSRYAPATDTQDSPTGAEGGTDG